MTVFVIEAVVACIIFSLAVGYSVTKNPLAWVEDYPPAIVERCRKLHLIEGTGTRRSRGFIIGKIMKTIVIIVVVSLVLIFVNHADSFMDGFLLSYGLWFIVAWFDALVVDCGWFAHSRRVIIPGTEDMVKEYHNYWFHIKMSIHGCLIGIPVCLLIGAHVAIAQMVM